MPPRAAATSATIHGASPWHWGRSVFASSSCPVVEMALDLGRCQIAKAANISAGLPEPINARLDDGACELLPQKLLSGVHQGQHQRSGRHGGMSSHGQMN